MIYRGGDQFGQQSDVDLAIILPSAAKDAIIRVAWIEKLREHKLNLEADLFQLLYRTDRSEPICSVVALTANEACSDIHKDGAEEFFKSNHFLNLLDDKEVDGLPNTGDRLIRDRLVRQCFRFAQKKRNEFLAVSVNGTSEMQAFSGTDPIPKDVMRHAAMAARLRSQDQPVGAEYDTQAGLDFLTNYLYDVRHLGAAYEKLHHWVSVRRGARGTVGPLQPRDWIFLSEIVWDLAHRALEATWAREADAASKNEPRVPGGHSTVFFADRFAQAFPGVRGVSWFEDADQIKMRLLTLLQQPLTFSNQRPVWWWRDGNLHIERFECTGDREFLMDCYELRIRKIAAVHPGSYNRVFVYVETEPMATCGLYKGQNIAAGVDRHGYYDEEFGLVDGKIMVTRGEYDDGATLIGGKLQDIRGRAELRVRYLTPFNFLVASVGSPINSPEFDRQIKELMNRMLKGEDALETIIDNLRRLPSKDL